MSERTVIIDVEARGLDKAVAEAKALDTAFNKLNNKGKVAIDSSQLNNLKTIAKQLDKDLDALKEKRRILIDEQGVDETSSKVKELDKQINKIESKKTQVQANLEVTGLATFNSNLKKATANTKSATSQIKSAFMGLQKLGGIGTSMQNIFNGNGNNPIGKLTHFLTQGIGYSAVYRGVTAGINMMNDALSGSVERFDAIRRSTKLLQRFGDENGVKFTEEQVNRLINGVHNGREEVEGLADSILGLPTTLDDALSHTTDLVSVTHDLDKAKDYYTALNDAALTFGGGEEEATRVLNQIIKGVAKEKIDGRALNAILSNKMAPVIQGVAEVMGLSTKDFQEQLSEGTITTEQFLDALVKLDKEGSKSFDSLREAVFDSVDTIQGSMQVLRARFTAGFTEILTAINDTVGEIFGDDRNLIYWIKQLGTGFKEQMKSVAETIREHKPEIQDFLGTLQEKFTTVWDELKKIDFLEIIKGVGQGIMKFGKTFFGFYKGLFDVAKKIAEGIGGGDFEKGFSRLVSGWITLSFTLKKLGSIGSVGVKFLSFAQYMSVALSGIGGAISKLPKISKFTNFMSGLFGGLSGKGKGESGSASALFSTEQALSSLKSIGVNFAKVIAVATEIAALSFSVKFASEQLKGIDWGQFALGMTGMLGAVTVMQGFTLGLGEITSKLATQEIFGLASMLGTGGALWLLSEAIGSFAKNVPDDVESFGQKLYNLGLAVTEITAFATVIGGLEVGTGGIGAVVALAGLTSLMGIGDVIKKLGKSIQELDKADLSTKNVKENVKSLKELVSALSEMTLDNIKFDFNQATQIDSAITTLANISKSVKTIGKTKIDTENAEKNIESLGTVIQTLNAKFSSFKNSGSTLLNVDNIADSVKAIDELTKLPEGLVNFTTKMDEVNGKLDESKATDYATKLSQALGSISAGMTTTSFNDFATKVKKASEVNKGIDNLKDMGTKLTEFQSSFPNDKVTDIQDSIKNLMTVLQSFKDNEIVEKADYLYKASSKFSTIKTAIGNLKSIVETLNSIQEMFKGKDAIKFDKDTFNGYIEQVRTALEGINLLTVEGGTLAKLTSAESTGLVDFDTVKTQLTDLKTMITTLGEIGTLFSGTEETSAVDLSGLKKQFETLGSALEELPTEEDLKIDEIVDFTALSEKVSTMSTDLANVVAQLNNAGALTLNEGIGEKIKQIRTAIDDLAGAFTEPANAHGAMSAVASASSGTIAQGITTMVSSIKSAVDTLNSIEFTQTGTDFAQQIVDGFESVDVGKAMVDAVNSAHKKVSGLTGKFGTLGRTFAQTLANGFRSNLNGMQQAVVSSAMNLGSAGGAFRSAGISLGNQLIQGIQSQLNRGVTVKATVSTSKSDGGVITPEGVDAFNSGIRQTIWDAIYNNNGGKVQYLSRGGMLAYFEPKGTDTVPAMLTPGEYVIKRKAVQTYGTGFFDKLNNMDLDGAFHSLTHSYQNSNIKNVTINNVSNNNSVYTDNRSVKVYGSNERSQRLKAGRYLRGLA